MQILPTDYRNAVISFSRGEFSEACVRLMNLVMIDWHPDILIGIRTGGYLVAKSMTHAPEAPLHVLPITCRRPTTRLKMISKTLRKLVSLLPRAILDRLRVIEHKFLTRGTPSRKIGNYEFDPAELAALEAWIARAGARPHILIVDDSVDTGTTLALVFDAVRRRSPVTAVIKSAVITVTTREPVIKPDYTLLHQKLCRFPWSMDAQPSRAP